MPTARNRELNERYKFVIRTKFDGDIVYDGNIDLRTLAKTLSAVQSMIDRSYLDIKFKGNIYKHSKMPTTKVADATFLVSDPKRESFLLDYFAETSFGKKIIIRINNALSPIYSLIEQKIDDSSESISKQVEYRREQILQDIIQVKTYDEAKAKPDPKIIRKYGDRSILKELDQMLSAIRGKDSGRSNLTLEMSGLKKTSTYVFNRTKSERFHMLVSRREVGSPIAYEGKLVQLDRVNKVGRYINQYNKRKCVIKFATESDVLKAAPYFDKDYVSFYGSPVVEYGSYDINSGDVFFIDIIK